VGLSLFGRGIFRIERQGGIKFGIEAGVQHEGNRDVIRILRRRIQDARACPVSELSLHRFVGGAANPPSALGRPDEIPRCRGGMMGRVFAVEIFTRIETRPELGSVVLIDVV